MKYFVGSSVPIEHLGQKPSGFIYTVSSQCKHLIFSFSTYCTILLSYFLAVSGCSQEYFPFSEIKDILKQQSPNTGCRPVHVLYRITICLHIRSQYLVPLTNNQISTEKKELNHQLTCTAFSSSIAHRILTDYCLFQFYIPVIYL